MAKCSNCNDNFECACESGKSPWACWCMNSVPDEEHLIRLKDEHGDDSCFCKNCIENNQSSKMKLFFKKFM